MQKEVLGIKVRDITTIALMSSLIAVGAFIKIPFLIVPITLQTFFVFLSGLILDKKQAFLSVVVYLIIGLIGIPVFAKGGGIGYVFQPSFGYLIGFLFSAYFISSFKDRFNIYLVLLIGILIIYLFGLIYFIFTMYFLNGKVFSVSYLFFNLFLIFLPGDVFSGIVAILIGKKILVVSSNKNL